MAPTPEAAAPQKLPEEEMRERMKGIRVRVRVLTHPFILWLGVREPLIKMNVHGWLGQIRQPIKHQIGSFRPIMDKMHKCLILCIIVA